MKTTVKLTTDYPLQIIARKGNYAELLSGLALARKVFGRLVAPTNAKADAKEEVDLEGLCVANTSYREFFATLLNNHINPYLIGLSESNLTDERNSRVEVLALASELLSSLLVHFQLPNLQESQIPEWLTALHAAVTQIDDPVSVCSSSRTFADIVSQPNIGLTPQVQSYIINETRQIHEVVTTVCIFQIELYANLF